VSAARRRRHGREQHDPRRQGRVARRQAPRKGPVEPTRRRPPCVTGASPRSGRADNALLCRSSSREQSVDVVPASSPLQLRQIGFRFEPEPAKSSSRIGAAGARSRAWWFVKAVVSPVCYPTVAFSPAAAASRFHALYGNGSSCCWKGCSDSLKERTRAGGFQVLRTAIVRYEVAMPS